MFDWRGILIGAVIVVFILGFQVLYGTRDQSPDTRFEAVLAGVLECLAEGNSTICARPAIAYALELKPGSEVMEILSRSLSARQCHYIGHVVGQQLYREYQDIESAIQNCSQTCDSACLHGIIGQAFAEELGYDDPEVAINLDLLHLSPDEIRKTGERLCVSSKTCHGVGHALFQTYGDIRPGLAMCREVAAGAAEQFCYHGVFMEYADVLTARNMRSIAEVTLPKIETLKSWCDYASLEERRSCFRYFPRTVLTALENEGVSGDEAVEYLKNMCISYEAEADRVACIVGMGVYWSYSLAGDVQTAIQNCRAFENSMEQAACNLGQISVATLERESRIMEYCTVVGDAALQSSCFQGLFYIINLLEGSLEDAVAICPNSICVEQAKNYSLDPLEEVQRSFNDYVQD